MHYDGNYRDVSSSNQLQLLEKPSRLLRWTLIPIFRKIETGSKIIYYHEIREEQFRSHIKYLSENYNIVALDELVDRIRNNKEISKRDVAIVFDDGRRTLYSDVYPVVREFNIPVTIYLTTEAIDEGVYIWDKVNALQKRDSSPGSVYELAKYPPKERQSLVDDYLTSKDITFERTCLNWEEITEMHNAGVDFQCHTQTHPSLPALEAELIENEITDSAAIIEEKLGTDVCHFSYPFGHSSEEIIKILRNNGFKSAVGVKPGYNTTETDVYQLHRVGVETASTSLLSTLIEGVWHRIVPGKQFRG